MTDTTRLAAFRAMQDGSLPGILDAGTTLYGIDVDTMNKTELRIALGWSLSQNARTMRREMIGVRRETRQ